MGFKTKEQQAEYSKAWRAKNPDKCREYEEKKKAKRQARADYMREYTRANKDKINAQRKARREARQKEVNEVRKAWRRTEYGAKYQMFVNARNRARRKGLPFEIELDDIEIPTHCPALGIELISGGEGGRGPNRNSPSLDRIIPELGYVKGNIVVVSYKANTMKNDATVEELLRVAEFYKNITKG